MTPHPPGRPAARPRIRVPRLTPEQKARVGAALEALLKRIRDSLASLARAVRAAFDAMTAALRQHRATARRDRPAWATPYGPAPRTPRTRR